MITINLIPQEHKLLANKKKIFIAVKEALLIILFFASIASIILMLSKYYLENQLVDMMNQNSNNIAIIQVTNNKIKKYNERINNADFVQKGFIKWSLVLEEVFKAKNESINLTNLKLYKKESILEISGTSLTRDELISFQERLEKVKYFNKVNLPLNNLISKENNNFNIRIEINTKDL